ECGQGRATERPSGGGFLSGADRLRRVSRGGPENVPRLPLKTDIEGYEEMMALRYLPQSDQEKEESKKEDRWNRFWIVPASVTRHQTKTKQLTLLDVPLQAETEAMNLVDGKLVSGNRPSSRKPRASAKGSTT